MNKCEPAVKRYCSELVLAIERTSQRDGFVDMNDLFNRFAFDVLLFSTTGLIAVARPSHFW